MKTHLIKFYSWLFERGDARVAAALRIAHGLLFIYILMDLYPTMDLVIGHAGIYGTLDPEFINPYHPLGLLYIFDSPLHLQIWFWISMGFAIATVVGLYTRVSIVLLLYSTLLLYTRTPHMLFGADRVFLHSLMIMVFLASDRRWSLDQYLRSRRGRRRPTEIELWPVKVIQLQIALLYLIAAFTKLTKDVWLDGSAVYYALHWQPFTWVGSAPLTKITSLMIFINYYTLVAELAFPFLVFRKRWKWIAIGMVLMMHLGIDTLMNIKFFALSMYVGYLSFIQPSEWQWVAYKLSRRNSSKELLHSHDTCGSRYQQVDI